MCNATFIYLLSKQLRDSTETCFFWWYIKYLLWIGFGKLENYSYLFYSNSDSSPLFHRVSLFRRLHQSRPSKTCSRRLNPVLSNLADIASLIGVIIKIKKIYKGARHHLFTSCLSTNLTQRSRYYLPVTLNISNK
jgi:hypothetical protein